MKQGRAMELFARRLVGRSKCLDSATLSDWCHSPNIDGRPLWLRSPFNMARSSNRPSWQACSNYLSDSLTRYHLVRIRGDITPDNVPFSIDIVLRSSLLTPIVLSFAIYYISRCLEKSPLVHNTSFTTRTMRIMHISSISRS